MRSRRFTWDAYAPASEVDPTHGYGLRRLCETRLVRERGPRPVTAQRQRTGTITFCLSVVALLQRSGCSGSAAPCLLTRHGAAGTGRQHVMVLSREEAQRMDGAAAAAADAADAADAKEERMTAMLLGQRGASAASRTSSAGRVPSLEPSRPGSPSARAARAPPVAGALVGPAARERQTRTALEEPPPRPGEGEPGG